MFFSLSKVIGSIALRKFSFLFFSLFLTNSLVQSQDCDDWAIEVCSAPYSPVDVCTDQTDACSQRYFYVYLVEVGSQVPNGSDEPFTFSSFSFSGRLGVNPTTGGVNLNNPHNATQKAHSHLDEKKTQQCSPYLPGTGTTSIDESSNLFAFHYFNDDGSNITWSVDGRRLLFVIAVDAYPDEVFFPDDMTGSFILIENIPGGGTINHTCNAFITTCNNDPLAKSVTLDEHNDECVSPLQFRFGSAISYPSTGFPNRIKVPVYATTGSNTPETFDLSGLDLLITILNTQPMGITDLEPGLVDLSKIQLYKEPPMNQSTDQRVYLETNEISITTFNTTPNPDNTLFYVIINGPALASSCATTTMLFTKYRRMFEGGNPETCCVPRKGGEFNYDWGASPCNDNCASTLLSIEPLGSLPPGADQCKDLFIKLMGSATSASQYKGAEIVMDIHHSGSLTLNFAGVSPTNSILCNSCITSTVISPDVLRITFSFIDGLFELGTPPAQLALFKFEGDGACISEVTFYDATLIKKDLAGTLCQPSVQSQIAEGTEDDLCSFLLSFCAYMWHDATLGAMAETDINYKITSDGDPTCNLSGLFTGCGVNQRCVCNTTENQIYYPYCNLDPLNGVNTYDLVVIGRHTLGLPAPNLDSPFKLIAADANNTNTITQGDIIEIRKLILGSITQFPANNSYRFLESSISFSDPLFPWGNGFQDNGPSYLINPSFIEEGKTFSVPPGGFNVEFKAVKIGDVNESVVFFTSTEDRTSLPLGMAFDGGKKGEVVKLPIYMRRKNEVAGWQAVLQYDPKIIEIKNVKWADESERDNISDFEPGGWNTPVPGELRLSWLTLENQAKIFGENEPLAYIEISFLVDVDNTVDLFTIGDAIPSEVYSLSGNIFPIDLVQEKAAEFPASTDKLDWSFSINPNPASGAYKLGLNFYEPEQVEISFFNTAGLEVYHMEKTFASGYYVLDAKDLPKLIPGQYFVRVRTSKGTKIAQLIYQD